MYVHEGKKRKNRLTWYAKDSVILRITPSRSSSAAVRASVSVTLKPSQKVMTTTWNDTYTRREMMSQKSRRLGENCWQYICRLKRREIIGDYRSQLRPISVPRTLQDSAPSCKNKGESFVGSSLKTRTMQRKSKHPTNALPPSAQQTPSSFPQIKIFPASASKPKLFLAPQNRSNQKLAFVRVNSGTNSGMTTSSPDRSIALEILNKFVASETKSSSLYDCDAHSSMIGLGNRGMVWRGQRVEPASASYKTNGSNVTAARYRWLDMAMVHCRS